MLWAAYASRATAICLLFLAVTSSGCGTIGGIIVGCLVSSHERSEDDTFCAKRGSDLKGDDYTRCHGLCMTEVRERRSKIKAREDGDLTEIEKRVAEEAVRTRSK